MYSNDIPPLALVCLTAFGYSNALLPIVLLFLAALGLLLWWLRDMRTDLRNRESVEVRNLVTFAANEDLGVSHVEVRWLGQGFFVPLEAKQFIVWQGKNEYCWKSKDDFDKFFDLPEFVRRALNQRMRVLSAEHYETCKSNYVKSKVAP